MKKSTQICIIIYIQAITVLIALALTHFGGRGTGPCMLPTMPEKTYIFGVKKEFTQLEVGQIVMAKADMGAGKQRVYKRLAKIDENGYYLLGDNPSNSYDSRYFGYVQYDDIIGVVTYYTRE